VKFASVIWVWTLLTSDCVVSHCVSRCWTGFTAGCCLVWVVHCILLCVVCSMFVRFADCSHFACVYVCWLFQCQTTSSQSRSFISSWQLSWQGKTHKTLQIAWKRPLRSAASSWRLWEIILSAEMPSTASTNNAVAQFETSLVETKHSADHCIKAFSYRMIFSDLGRLGDGVESGTLGLARRPLSPFACKIWPVLSTKYALVIRVGLPW